MAPSWPLQLLSTFTFEDVPGGKTKFTVRWTPFNPTEEERTTFDAGHASMTGGWSGTMDKLEGLSGERKIIVRSSKCRFRQKNVNMSLLRYASPRGRKLLCVGL